MTIDVKARRVSPREKKAKQPRARRGPDPRGRIDVLASRTVDELMKTANPIAQAVHRQLKPDLDEVLKAYLGPRNPKARRIREAVRRGMNLIVDVRKAQLEQMAKAQSQSGGRAA